MTVTVLAILETDFVPDKALGRVMNERLQKAAFELQEIHLAELKDMGERNEDVVVYISYNPKYKIRYRVVNDVPAVVENKVGEVCGNLGYLFWKTATVNVFKGN